MYTNSVMVAHDMHNPPPRNKLIFDILYFKSYDYKDFFYGVLRGNLGLNRSSGILWLVGRGD